MSIRAVARGAYREALGALAISAAGGLVAGLVLGGMRRELQLVPGLLVLVPALLATRGNVYGSLGARLSSGLHQGLVEPGWPVADPRVRSAVAAAIANGLLASAFAATAAWVVLGHLSRPVAPLGTLVAVALLAGVLSGSVLVVAVVSVVFVGYRQGRDPDTLVGPMVTTTGDVFGLTFLLLAVRVVVGGG